MQTLYKINTNYLFTRDMYTMFGANCKRFDYSSTYQTSLIIMILIMISDT